MVLDREVLFLLFCLDGWPLELNKFGVGCHWGSSFAGAFSYADDVVLLAPCTPALRTVLNICSTFNLVRMQLMCFLR